MNDCSRREFAAVGSASLLASLGTPDQTVGETEQDSPLPIQHSAVINTDGSGHVSEVVEWNDGYVACVNTGEERGGQVTGQLVRTDNFGRVLSATTVSATRPVYLRTANVTSDGKFLVGGAYLDGSKEFVAMYESLAEPVSTVELPERISNVEIVQDLLGGEIAVVSRSQSHDTAKSEVYGIGPEGNINWEVDLNKYLSDSYVEDTHAEGDGGLTVIADDINGTGHTGIRIDGTGTVYQESRLTTELSAERGAVTDQGYVVVGTYRGAVDVSQFGTDGVVQETRSVSTEEDLAGVLGVDTNRDGEVSVVGVADTSKFGPNRLFVAGVDTGNFVLTERLQQSEDEYVNVSAFSLRTDNGPTLAVGGDFLSNSVRSAWIKYFSTQKLPTRTPSSTAESTTTQSPVVTETQSQPVASRTTTTVPGMSIGSVVYSFVAVFIIFFIKEYIK